MARRPSSVPQQILLPSGSSMPDEEQAEVLDSEVLAENPDQDPDDLGEPWEDPETGDWHYGKQPDNDDEEQVPEDSVDLEEFFQNLAEDKDIQSEVHLEMQNLLDLIKQDFEDRKPRDEQYADGINRTGLGKTAPGGAMFEGASKAVHPVLMEGCIDFAGKAIKELMPAQGPVKTHITGTNTKDKLAKAERKREHMNWQLTQDIPEFRNQLEQLLSQVPLGGTQYLHWWHDDRDHVQFLPIDDVVIPADASSYATAARITIRELALSEFEFKSRVKSGRYVDPETMPNHTPSDKTDSEKANEKVEGKEESGQNLEGQRPTVTCFCWVEVKSDDYTKGELHPYKVSLDYEDGTLLELRRNWDPTLPEETKVERMEWLVPFDFIVWRGPIAVGLGQIIGSLAGSLTGALRALLDTAHINNSATLLKLKGANIGGQSTQVEVTQIGEIEGPPGIDDIRKLAMPMPFNPPSEVLFKLLDWIAIQAKGVVATADEKIADAGQNTPVGTVMALIEQGSVTFSAIHARLHASMMECLKILHRMNKFWLEDEQILEDLGELIVRREDYEGPMDVIPVSDPAIFSETQRVAQVQGLMELRTLFPGLLVDRAILKRALHVLKVPDVQEVLPDEYKPSPINPVAENLQMFLGQPAFAFPDQDHEAHLQVHVSFVLDQNLGSNPAFITTFVPPFLEHAKQHVGFWYVQRSLEMFTELTGVQMDQLDYASPESQEALARAMASLAPLMMAESKRVLSQIGPILGQAAQMVQQLQKAQFDQQAQMMGKGSDPAAMAEVQRRAQRDQMDGQLKAGELQAKQLESKSRAEESQARTQGEQQRTQMEMRRDSLEAQKWMREQALEERAMQLEELAQMQGIKLDAEELRRKMREQDMHQALEIRGQDMERAISQEDNLTALTIAEKQIKAGKGTQLKNGNAIGA